jgi:hypothetical protein
MPSLIRNPSFGLLQFTALCENGHQADSGGSIPKRYPACTKRRRWRPARLKDHSRFPTGQPQAITL